MNTSSVKLSTYDVIVALVESETGKSLHDHVDDLRQKVPRASAYADLPELVLDVVTLRQNRVPSQAGYRGVDFAQMLNEWDQVIACIKGMVSFLEEENIFDANRLPSYTAIPVIAALWGCLPAQPDAIGNVRVLLRKYLWRAFLTERYEQASASGALQDYRALKDLVAMPQARIAVPIFNDDIYPVPNTEIILRAPWPKGKSIIGRGLLALQLKCGAEDIADGARASVATITSKDHPREYHHLFPDAKLSEANLAQEDIYLAVNCALIMWKTNRTISDKSPVHYLRERADISTLGEEELRRRLRTHLIPYAQLNVGVYQDASPCDAGACLREDYRKFREARAELFKRAADLACNGQQLDINAIFAGLA